MAVRPYDFIRREVLTCLDDPDRRGAFVLGEWGTGKSTLLRAVRFQLLDQQRPAFLVQLSEVSDGDLAWLIYNVLRERISLPREQIVRGSRQYLPFGQLAALMNQVADGPQRPVLLLDDLDRALYPDRMVAAIEALSRDLDGWQLVVASRSDIEHRRFPGFTFVYLTPQPGHADRSARTIERLIDNAQGDSPTPAMFSLLIDELALAGGRDEIAALARKLRSSESDVRTLVADVPVGLLSFDRSADALAFPYREIQEFVLFRRVFTRPFSLGELTFGAEDAERDDLLDASFVERDNLDRIVGQRQSIVVGDRGSGKSAIFRKLDEDQPVRTLPIENPGDLLHRIVGQDSWLDTDALRAAWLVVVAAVVADVIPEDAPKALRHDAHRLRAALGLPTAAPSGPKRALSAVGGLLGGTTLKFGVGPATFEAKLPDGARSTGSFLDAGTLLRDVDRLFAKTDQRVLVLLDRIDETFKYDRIRQEALIQALLQAEAKVSLLGNVEFVVFLRTDVFELYDIQEKTKLVSRMLKLRWSEDDWLRVLIRRMFANEPFARLAERLHVADDRMQTRAALEVLFPAEIEDQPVDRWLIDSLSNGNSDISPRLAVLLLLLARNMSPRGTERVVSVPLFSADAVQRAMTEVSALSIDEVINDFKVAPTFVLSCRAGKLTEFTLADVRGLFDEAEGKISDQVRLLERLGFLERVVEQRGDTLTSLFRIPPLYTRCWDFA